MLIWSTRREKNAMTRNYEDIEERKHQRLLADKNRNKAPTGFGKSMTSEDVYMALRWHDEVTHRRMLGFTALG